MQPIANVLYVHSVRNMYQRSLPRKATAYEASMASESTKTELKQSQKQASNSKHVMKDHW